MSDVLPLPNLHQSFLDPETLDCFERDLTQLVRILEVKTRASAGPREPQAVVSVRVAIQELRDGLVTGVQIRYVHEGTHWLDTLLSTPLGIRLTRINLSIS